MLCAPVSLFAFAENTGVPKPDLQTPDPLRVGVLLQDPSVHHTAWGHLELKWS